MNKDCNKKNQKGFSLIELIIVIALLGIIIGIATPSVTGALDNAKKQADITNANAIANAIILLETIEEGSSGIGVVASVEEATVGTQVIEGESAEAKINNLVEELNGNVPTIQFSSEVAGTDESKDFYAVIEEGSKDVVVTTSNGTQLYPEPAVPWGKVEGEIE